LLKIESHSERSEESAVVSELPDGPNFRIGDDSSASQQNTNNDDFLVQIRSRIGAHFSSGISPFGVRHADFMASMIQKIESVKNREDISDDGHPQAGLSH
jgi:hypothetical protein